jgi:Nif-specific regulatory protein
LSREEAERGVFKRGEGIIGKVYKMGLPVVLSDLHVSQYLNKTGLRDRLSGRETFVAVPIKVGEETVGVLAFFKEFKRESVEEGIKLAMILGNHVRDAIQDKPEGGTGKAGVGRGKENANGSPLGELPH